MKRFSVFSRERYGEFTERQRSFYLAWGKRFVAFSFGRLSREPRHD
ncbi:MAG: hypothetical protein AAF494_01720 [Pseudomonadota bacterium]